MFRHRISSVRLIPLSFLAAILLGAVLLTLPISSASGQSTTFTDALFTSATSVCVTGLTVVTTAYHWSIFGKVVIVCLIQIGGLGIITIYSLIMLLAHRRFTLSDRIILQDALNLRNTSGVLKFLTKESPDQCSSQKGSKRYLAAHRSVCSAQKSGQTLNCRRALRPQ